MGFFDEVGKLTGGVFDPNVTGSIKGAWNDLTGKSAADAAAEAARLQGTAADRAIAENRRQFDITQGNLAPWLAAGKGALSEQQALMGLGGDTAGAMRALQSSPGYQQRMQQGLRSLSAGIGARGGMGSGKALTAGTMFNQDYAANEYGNRLNQLAGLSGTGQTTASNLGGLGAQYAQSQGNLWTGAANAAGAAGIAGANARQSGLLGLLGAGATFASDPRLKTDVKRIGTHKSGIGWYSWKYIDKPEDFPDEYSHLANWGEYSDGVMADEVREIMPDAISKAGDYDIVNYSLLEGHHAS